MPFVDFSDSDLLRNKLVTPAWYQVHIDSVDEWKVAKTGTSNNLVYEVTIVKNADTDDEEFAGVPVIMRFNDSPKAKGIIDAFLKSLGVETSAGRFELAAAVGKKLDVYIGNSVYEGRVRNEVQSKFRQAKSA